MTQQTPETDNPVPAGGFHNRFMIGHAGCQMTVLLNYSTGEKFAIQLRINNQNAIDYLVTPIEQFSKSFPTDALSWNIESTGFPPPAPDAIKRLGDGVALVQPGYVAIPADDFRELVAEWINDGKMQDAHDLMDLTLGDWRAGQQAVPHGYPPRLPSPGEWNPRRAVDGGGRAWIEQQRDAGSIDPIMWRAERAADDTGHAVLTLTEIAAQHGLADVI